MFKRLLRRLKRALIMILALGGIVLIVVTIINTRNFFSKGEIVDVIIDVDTGMDAEKAIALTRALISKEINVIAITSAQWQIHPDSPPNSVRLSKKVNDTILQLLNLHGIPSLTGAKDQLSYWGEPEPGRSDASDFIIQTVKRLGKNEKINILCLGPMTNLASAILLDPTIASGIRAHVLGALYDSRTGVWNKNEFNIRNDPDAFDILLNNRNLDLYVMPSNIAGKLHVNKETSRQLMQDKGGIFQYLYARLQEKHPYNNKISMPSLALVEALVNPKYAKPRNILTPPENYRRKVMVYNFINEEQMLSSFTRALRDKNLQGK